MIQLDFMLEMSDCCVTSLLHLNKQADEVNAILTVVRPLRQKREGGWSALGWLERQPARRRLCQPYRCDASYDQTHTYATQTVVSSLSSLRGS